MNHEFYSIVDQYSSIKESMTEEEKEREEELIDIIYYEMEGIEYMIEEKQLYGQCEKCCKFTSVFKGAKHSFYAPSEEYGEVMEVFICPACQQKT